MSEIINISGTYTGSFKVQDWIEPALSNGWQSFGGEYTKPGYYKDANGIVHIKGLVRSGQLSKTIFTLPKDYRPKERYLFTVGCSSGSGMNIKTGRCDIIPTGDIIPIDGSNNWFSLDGLSFISYTNK